MYLDIMDDILKKGLDPRSGTAFFDEAKNRTILSAYIFLDNKNSKNNLTISTANRYTYRGAKQGGLGGCNPPEFWRGGFNPPDFEKKI